MFKQARDGMRRTFFSRHAQVAALAVLFGSVAMFVRHYYLPLYDITFTYVAVAVVMQLVGLVSALWCYQLTAEALFQVRTGDKAKRSLYKKIACLSSAAFLGSVGLGAATLFRQVGMFTFKLPGVTLFFPGTHSLSDFVAAGRLAMLFSAFVLVAFGTLFCEPIARRTRARAAPRQHVATGVE